MYEKDIREFEQQIECNEGWATHSALKAAVALMRAAEPKDEAAERAECETIAASYVQGTGPVRLRDVIMHTRAAARAEGHAAGVEDTKQHYMSDAEHNARAYLTKMSAPKDAAAEQRHCTAAADGARYEHSLADVISRERHCRCALLSSKRA